jgi:hypothetical protein
MLLELLTPPPLQQVVSFGLAKALNEEPRLVVAPPLTAMTPASAATPRPVRTRETRGRVAAGAVEEVGVAWSGSAGVVQVGSLGMVLISFYR